MATWVPPPSSPTATFAEMEFAEDEDEDADFVPLDGESDDEKSVESGSDGGADAEDGEEAEAVDEAEDGEDEGLTGHIDDVPVPLSPDPTTLPLPPLPAFDPAFPLLAFLRTYRNSDSMWARRRRWRLIKQWDVLFASYRKDGWERDEFCLRGTTWVMGGQPELYQCQCAEESQG